MNGKKHSFKDATFTCPFCGGEEVVSARGVAHYGPGHHIIMSLERLNMMSEKEMLDYGFNPNQLVIEEFVTPRYGNHSRKDKNGQLSFL